MNDGAGGDTNLSIIAVVFVLLAGLIILASPRNYVVVPFPKVPERYGIAAGWVLSARRVSDSLIIAIVVCRIS